MAVWSSAFRALGQSVIKSKGLSPAKLQSYGGVRAMSDHGPRIFPLVPSRWQWNRTKDMFHEYFMIGIIPVTIIITGSYIFVGPATLEEIPEGYTPKHWEYYRNPISRFMSRYLFTSAQQEYEKGLHHLWDESERMKIRELEERIKDLIEERRDYQAFYYRPAIAKYHRRSRQAREELEAVQGD